MLRFVIILLSILVVVIFSACSKDLSKEIHDSNSVLALANKEYNLEEGYEPGDLVVPDVRFPFEESHEKKQMRRVAAIALEEMFEIAEMGEVILFAQSGYRSFDRQVSVFNSNVEKSGEEHANTYSAKPGESEHQTGLVMDVTSQDIGFRLVQAFGETKEGQWLKKHAHEYGFIIRYPEGKEDITGYIYEPWHIRYLGVEMATNVYESGLTYEEYLEKVGVEIDRHS